MLPEKREAFDYRVLDEDNEIYEIWKTKKPY
jgi:hypothetical protein